MAGQGRGSCGGYGTSGPGTSLACSAGGCLIIRSPVLALAR
jgi:hypothetical protein